MNLEEEIFNIKEASQFEDLCLKIFDLQMNNNELYNKYAKAILKNKLPNNIYEIPFLPIEFFKTHNIIKIDSEAEKIFYSSGTTNKKSKHLITDLDIYKKSFIENFIQIYGEPDNYIILALLPSYLESKDSSLIYMVDSLIKKSKNKHSKFYNNNIEELHFDLCALEKKQKKILLFGVTYALLDFAKKYPMKLKNTTIIETGGMKGKRKEISKEEMHEILKKAFKLKDIHSEYGMTELLSQAYSKKNNIFNSPNWMKILIRDINDPISIIGDNTAGGINIIDLANINSCPFIATQDLGISYNNNSFSVLGRLSNADLRGCNLLFE